MKTNLLLMAIGLIFVTVAGAANQPVAEIADYGIYTGGQNQNIPDTGAPTGLILNNRGQLSLVKQTDKIPAQLGKQFGFRFVIHGKQADGKIKLHFVWLYPEITNQSSGKKSTRFEADGYGQPENRNDGIMWTFTEPSELVPGEWTFQVFRDGGKILEKKFAVEKPDEKQP